MLVDDDVLGQMVDIWQLKEGWHFGEGTTILHWCLGNMIAVSGLLTRAKALKQEVFPSTEGGVLVCGYRGRNTIEIYCNPDKYYTFRFQVNEQDVKYQEHLTFEDVIQYIDEIYLQWYNLDD